MIGIIAAMEVEIKAIEALADIESEADIGVLHCTYGKLHDRDIVLCQSGVGKVGAAMAATALCLHHKLEALINIGTAGGLLSDQKVLDIVIADKVVQADYDTSPLDGPEGLGLRFAADPDWIDTAKKAAEANAVRYHIGQIASQDLFMSRDEDRQRLMERFPASACSEMEAGAVAQVASTFQIPFVIVRSLSDVVVHNDNPMEFTRYAALASAQSAGLVAGMLGKAFDAKAGKA